MQGCAERRETENEADAEHSATVLVVEDNALVRFELAQALRSADYNVIEACEADEAVAVANAGGGLDVLITDVNMPGSLDGLALACVVRQQMPAARIVVVSAREHDYQHGTGWSMRAS